MEDTLVISASKLPPFDLVVRCYLNHYLKKMRLHMLPSSRWRYLVFVIEALHLIIATGAFTIGILLPPALLPYNILFVALVMIGWKMLGYCWVTKIVSLITGKKQLTLGESAPEADDQYTQFVIPLSEKFLILYGLLVIALSAFFYMKPEYAPFNLLKLVCLKLYAWVRL